MELEEVFGLFADKPPKEYTVKNTSHGEQDFRETIIATWEDGVLAGDLKNRLVIKLAANGFTDEAHLLMWEQLAGEYRRLGYYCPRFVRSRSGNFEKITYKGHNCILYAEEYSVYRSAEEYEKQFSGGKFSVTRDGVYTYLDDVLRMNARIAAKHFDFAEFPSGYCLFELFDPADHEDEVMENAHEWLKVARALPDQYQPQIDRIWERFMENREYVRARYDELPSSVFQADLNNTNILLDEDRNFKGVYDFNLAGKDKFLNYLFREVPYISFSWDKYREDAEDLIRANWPLGTIFHALRAVREEYVFNDLERELALPLYRLLKSLWSDQVEELGKAKDDEDICKCLAKVEKIQTEEIDFASVMSGNEKG